ncbi:MAG: hypothetical protein ACE14T_04375 [Syntrophales bacterium]
MRYHRREQASGFRVKKIEEVSGSVTLSLSKSVEEQKSREIRPSFCKTSASYHHAAVGFALVAALLATLIIMAVGILALFLTTRDIRVSYRVVAEKKTMAAAETGIHQLMSSFDPENLAASARTNIQADPSDASFRYSISTPTRPSGGPEIVPLAGYSIGGGQQWGQTRFTAEVTGENTLTGTKVPISIGLGYGPIEFTTMSR